MERVRSGRDNAVFQTVLYTEQLPPIGWVEERSYTAIYAGQVSLDDEENLRIVVDEYKLERADEIYLLSERFYGAGGARHAAVVINDIANDLKRLPSAELGEERFAAITQGDAPEQFAGRLPRIFVWDDLDTTQVADPEMERLMIRLPAEWRDKPERSERLAPVVNTVAEKSWRERRRQILAQR